MPCDRLKVVIAHASAATREKLVAVVEELGHEVQAICRTTGELKDACRASPPGLVFSGIDLPDGDAIAALVEISDAHPTPAIIVTPKTSLVHVERALQDHVMAYLVEPVDPPQVKPTVYLVCERFKEFEALREENEDLKQVLADRRIIERAKGILMGRDNLTEQDAFRTLQKLAQSRRAKLVLTAESIIAETEAKAS